MEDKGDDITINGPGSPISIKKLSDLGNFTRKFTILVDGSHQGFIKDDPSMFVVSPEMCAEQAIYYSKIMFNGRDIPSYLYRYMHYMFIDDTRKNKELLYPTDKDLITAYELGEIDESSKDYQTILNLIKYCEHNAEAKQIIGFIQIVAGVLNSARKQKKGIRIFLERPETALHPKRQSAMMNLMMMLEKEFYPDEQVN
jgi:hypothetical protein